MTKRNPEFDGFSAYFAVRAETDRKGKSTPPARTETPTYQQQMSHHNISTHSAHEDGDYISGNTGKPGGDFNPLRPRGRRPDAPLFLSTSYAFQPTPPTRTETSDIAKIVQTTQFQPTPPTRTETLWHGTCMTGEKKFQPTPPTRTETLALLRLRRLSQISTHSAHEDGDLTAQTISLWTATFQPTPPTRTETLPRIQGSRHQPISTHSAHEDGDIRRMCKRLR